MEPLKIVMAGCSGVGKTTLAKWISEKYNIPFISGSYSDLVPETKNMYHADMLALSQQQIQLQDTQLLNLRYKACMQHSEGFVSDRSALDSAAYFINKLSHRLPECEVEAFLNLCMQILAEGSTHLIYIPYSVDFMKTWDIEDNNKRILNKYYQYQITNIIDGLLDLWKFQPTFNSIISKQGILPVWYNQGGEACHKNLKVLILNEQDFSKRQVKVEDFLSK